MNTGLFVVYLAGFFVFIKVFTYTAIVIKLLGLRFKKSDCQLCDPADVPSYLKNLFDAHSKKLQDLGFCYSHYQICEDPVVTVSSKRLSVVYFNPSVMCYADVGAAFLPEQNFPVKIGLESRFSDGYKLITVNGQAHDILGKIPKATLIDPYSETFEGQLQTHLEELAKLKGQRELITLRPEDYVEAERSSIRDYYEGLKLEGLLKEAGDGYYKLRLIPAISYLFKYVKGSRKQKALLLKKRKLSKIAESMPVDVPAEVESDAFLRIQGISASKKIGYAGKIAVFAVSLLIFVAAFKISFSFDVILILIGVLIIHELGHLISMKLFKYKDVQVLFLPFIGAATVGSDRKATVLQRVVVYLMGPAPGIIIGTCCMILYTTTHNKLLSEFGLFLLILNYLNMLPIVPLDGGRIFELTLFSRVHFLKSLFLILSVAVLGIAGISLRDPILIVISVFLFLGIHSQIQQNRELSALRRKIKAENIELKDEVIVPTIFKMLKGKPVKSLSFEKKFRIAKYLLDNSMTEPPSISTTLLSLFMYFVVWLLPVFVILTIFMASLIWGLILKS